MTDDRPDAATGDADARLFALDLIRGVAVLGILAVNIAGFAGPTAATYTPRAVLPPDPLADGLFAGMLVLFEGKMRALFSILFGASMMLFVERADAAGRDGQMLQLRRLGWLALLGYLHFALLWWGDILFLYAIAGGIALAFRHMPMRGIAIVALFAFTVWQAQGIASRLPSALAEYGVAEGTADAAAARGAAVNAQRWQQRIDAEMAHYRLGFAEQARERLSKEPFEPVRGALFTIGETVPYMLAGMLLYMTGFFAGEWPRRRLRAITLAGIGLGGAASISFAAWAWASGFPPMTMILAINHALGFPHFAMAMGYAALLMLWAPRIARSAMGHRLATAGRMAFSNYIGTSILMTALFYGWGLGLVGQVPYAALPLFVLLAWGVMLGWSAPWLVRFRQGPLEWLWRSLAEMRIMPMKR